MAKYFDGLSSKPHYVDPSIDGNVISIKINESQEELDSWILAECKIDNLNADNDVTISYGTFPKAILQFHASDYPGLYDTLLSQQSTINKSYHILNRFNPLQIVLVSTSVIVVTVFIYLKYLAPWVGGQVVKAIPTSFDAKVGKTALNQLLAFQEVDTLQTMRLQEFFDLCDYPTDYTIETTYVDDEVVNAFAAPGGYIVVYDGIIKKTKSYDELAGLLAHELAHINQRHSMVNIARSVSGYLVLSVITGDVAGSSGVILEQANQLYELSNSRSFEREADLKGLDYMQNSSIDKSGMLRLFENISAIDSHDTSYMDRVTDNLDFLSTHPSSEQRINEIQENLNSKPNTYDHHHKLDSLWSLLIESN